MNIEELLPLVPRIDPTAASVESRGRWWTWGEVATLTDAVCKSLDEASCPAGGRIGLLLRNRAPQLAALIACVVSGRCAVAFNPVLPAVKLAEDVRTQAPELLVGAREDLDGRNTARVAAGLGIPVLLLPDEPNEVVEWLSARRSVQVQSPEKLRPEMLVEMLSSGTTGPPKRIPLSRANFNQSFRSAQAV